MAPGKIRGRNERNWQGYSLILAGMRVERETMPKWPAWILGTVAAACVYPAATASHPDSETYRAHGQEPGWTLTIAHGRINYVGDHGERRISVARPDPRPSFNGPPS